MSNAFDAIRAALTDARQANNAVDTYVGQMAELCAGRLQKSNATLRQLKQELRRYNPHTRSWRKAR